MSLDVHYPSTPAKESDNDGWSSQGPVTELSDEHAWRFLASQSFGRLALVSDDRPQIFPINFAVLDHTVLFRTAGGNKLRELIQNRHVALEADALTDSEAWSVVLRGRAEMVIDDEGVRSAEKLHLPRWIPVQPYVFIRITPVDIRARHFTHHVRAELGRS